jgi:hypothetical protein
MTTSECATPEIALVPSILNAMLPPADTKVRNVESPPMNFPAAFRYRATT